MTRGVCSIRAPRPAKRAVLRPVPATSQSPTAQACGYGTTATAEERVSIPSRGGPARRDGRATGRSCVPVKAIGGGLTRRAACRVSRDRETVARRVSQGRHILLRSGTQRCYAVDCQDERSHSRSYCDRALWAALSSKVGGTMKI